MKYFTATTTRQKILNTEWLENRTTHLVLIQNKGTHSLHVCTSGEVATSNNGILIEAKGSIMLPGDELKELSIIADNDTLCSIFPL